MSRINSWLMLMGAVFVGIFDSCQGQRQEKLIASLGGQLTLGCDLRYPRGRPERYIVQWRKENISQPIFIKYDDYPAQVPHEQYRNRIQLVEEASLQISHIRADDEGWYECNIIFIDGTDETTVNGSWVYLLVNSPPRILASSPQLLQHRRGETITMFCEGKGSPTPSLVWRKDGRPVETDFRTSVQGNRVTITGVQRSDGGTYTCTFTNTVGEISQLIKLVVEGGPYITEYPQNTTAVKGQRVHFKCGAAAYPNNITHYWAKDGVDIRDTSGFKAGRINITADGGLLISSVVKSDLGMYLCRPSNGFGEVEATAYLNVTYHPVVLSMPGQLVWPRGLQGNIHCPVDANPPMIRTLWSKDGEDIHSTGRRDILSNGTLQISNVTMGDAGSYLCTPISNMGSGQSSQNVQVIVRDPPYFVTRPAELYQKMAGDDVAMPCYARGTPDPIITWKKELSMLEMNDRITIDTGVNGALRIRMLQKEDHGRYVCVARNEVTDIFAFTELRIMNTTPHAPYNVTVTTTMFSAKVTWQPAYDGGSPQHYILWFRRRDVPNSRWETMLIPDGATSFTVYTLYPDTPYEFIVLARNSFGNSSNSVAVEARTLGFVRDMVTALPTDSMGNPYYPNILENVGPSPFPPRNLSVSELDSGILVLHWMPPVNLTHPVPVFYYKVQLRSGEGSWADFNRTNQTNMPLMGLPAGMTYSVRVMAAGVSALSEPTPPLIIKIPARRNLPDNSASAEPFQVPNALIGGIVGGLLFLLVAVLLAIIAVIHSRKKEQKSKETHRYNDVNYSKPEEMETNNRHRSKKSDQDHRVKLRQNGIVGNHLEEETL